MGKGKRKKKDVKTKQRLKQDDEERTKGNRNNTCYELAQFIVIMNWFDSPLSKKVLFIGKLHFSETKTMRACM